MKRAWTWFGLPLLAVLLSLMFVAGAARAEEPITFEVRDVTDRPGPNAREYLSPATGSDGKAEKIVLAGAPLLDASAIRFVALDYDASDKPRIIITLTRDGAKRFAQITKERYGKQLAFVLGGQVYAAPLVLETITGGKIAINSNLTPREATNLVGRLNAVAAGDGN